jgi:signal transduction histidine kinase
VERTLSIVSFHGDTDNQRSLRLSGQDVVTRLALRALGGAPAGVVVEAAAEVARGSLHADYCGVFDVASDGASLLLSAGTGWREGAVGSARMSAEVDSLGGPALRRAEPVVIPDLRREAHWHDTTLLREHGVVSCIEIALSGPHGVAGMLGVYSRTPRLFANDDGDFLQGIAELVVAVRLRGLADTEHARLAADATAAHAALQEASRARSDFLATMSHELRTPLNTIANFVAMLELEGHGPLTAAQRADVAGIRRSEQYLRRLTDDVLSFVKVAGHRPRLDIRNVSVAGTLAAVEELIGPLLQAKDLSYERGPVEGAACVRADPGKLQQILLNLLSNAVKFTARGGSVRVDCWLGDPVTIVVRDTGCGIPANKLDKIFDPFVQLETAFTRTSEGAGLGLAISRELAEAMGGRIVVESEVARGSAFGVVLPRGS